MSIFHRKPKFDGVAARNDIYNRIATYRVKTRTFTHLDEDHNCSNAIAEASRAILQKESISEEEYEKIKSSLAQVEANFAPDNDYLLGELFTQVSDVLKGYPPKPITQSKHIINSTTAHILALTAQEGEIQQQLIALIKAYGPSDPRVIALSGRYQALKKELDNEMRILQDYVDYDVASEVAKQKQRYIDTHRQIERDTGIDPVRYHQLTIEEETERRRVEANKARFSEADNLFPERVASSPNNDVFATHPELLDLMDEQAKEEAKNQQIKAKK